MQRRRKKAESRGTDESLHECSPSELRFERGYVKIGILRSAYEFCGLIGRFQNGLAMVSTQPRNKCSQLGNVVTIAPDCAVDSQTTSNI